MKKIYKNKLFVFSILAFLSMNIFGGVYGQEDVSETEKEAVREEKILNEVEKEEAEKEEVKKEEVKKEEAEKEEAEKEEVKKEEKEKTKDAKKNNIKEEDVKLNLVTETKNEPVPTEFERLFIEGRSISGETHTIKVDVRSSKKLLYRFYEKNLSTNKWTRIQDYSEKSSANWIPKGKGDYRYRVDIKEADSKKDIDISKSALIRIEPSKPAVLDNLEILGTSEAKTLHKIVANATSQNGVLYKFYIRNKRTGAVDTIQNYSENNTIEWTPEEPGNYEYGVDIKDKKSWEDKEGSKVIPVEIVPLKPAVLHSLELEGNKYEKSEHTLTANASSTNGVLYKFFIKNEKTGSTQTLQNFTEKNTATWKPMTNGKYSYNVIVKDKRSSSNRDAFLSYEVTINPPVYYKTTEYNDTLDQALNKQVKKNTIWRNGKWVQAAKEEIKEYLDPDRFLQFKPAGKEGHIITVEVEPTTLNVRRQPSASSDIIATVKKGDVYVVIDDENGWHKINISGKMGWISGDYVKYINDVPREMYQFMVLSGQAGVETGQMNNQLKNKGILEGKGAAFIEGSRKYNVNELYLLAHCLLETGNGTSKLATGILVSSVNGKAVPPRIVYNMYGIGAFDKGPLKYGSERAYTEGWFTPELAIIEGAQWISSNYINNKTYNQDTLYKMKYNPSNPGVHQYATDIAWALKQTRQIDIMMELYRMMEGIAIRFDIPRYKQ